MAFFPSDLFIEFAALSPSEQTALKQENPQFARFESERPNQRMAEFLQSKNIPFIDLTNSLVNQRASGVQISLPIDGHWTKEGNRIVAETLANWLTEQELLIE